MYKNNVDFIWLIFEEEEKYNLDSLKFIDVTMKWLNSARPNYYEIEIENKYIDDNSIKHPLKGKENIHFPSANSDEIKVANWLNDTFGGKIKLIPSFTAINNYRNGVSSPDFIWNDEKWDLKTPIGNGPNTLNKMIEKKEKQAHNFIFDISKTRMTKELAIRQIKQIFYSNYRSWVDTVILIDDNVLICILKRKK